MNPSHSNQKSVGGLDSNCVASAKVTIGMEDDKVSHHHGMWKKKWSYRKMSRRYVCCGWRWKTKRLFKNPLLLTFCGEICKTNKALTRLSTVVAVDTDTNVLMRKG